MTNHVDWAVLFGRLAWLETFLSKHVTPFRIMNKLFGIAGGLFNKFDGSAELLDDLNDHCEFESWGVVYREGSQADWMDGIKGVHIFTKKSATSSSRNCRSSRRRSKCG